MKGGSADKPAVRCSWPTSAFAMRVWPKKDGCESQQKPTLQIEHDPGSDFEVNSAGPTELTLACPLGYKACLNTLQEAG